MTISGFSPPSPGDRADDAPDDPPTPDTVDGAPSRDNPFVGPRSIPPDAILHGRDRETLELRDRLVADRIVLMYSPSGAGKTSLINAGLRPEMEDRGFVMLPVPVDDGTGAFTGGAIRLNLPDDEAAGNRYAASVKRSLGADVATPLSQCLDDLVAGTSDGKPVCLVFDQFEELITADPADRTAKIEFMIELGDALRDAQRERPIWALFAMREDYLAPFDEFRQRIPGQLRSRFRLDLLSAEQAKAVAVKTAGSVGVRFVDDAADQLVRNLCSEPVGSDGARSTTEEADVEPVQLQVVCRSMWNPDRDTIGESDVPDRSGVDGALAGFYSDEVEQVAEAADVPERWVRSWVGTVLINEHEYRTQTQTFDPVGFEGDGGDEVIAGLVDAHLVRADVRNRSRWFELAHDRLVRPVLQSNQAWEASHLEPFQRRAAAWDQARRPRDMLMSGAELRAAKRWSAAHRDEVFPVEDRYLKESGEYARRRLILVGSGCLLALVAVGALLFVLTQQRRTAQAERTTAVALAESESARADREEALAESERERANAAIADAERERAEEQERIATETLTATGLAEKADTLQASNSALALSVASESTGITDESTASSLASLVSARASFRERPWLVSPDSPVAFGSTPRRVAVSGAGLLAVGDADGTIHLVALDNPGGEPIEIDAHDDPMGDLVFSPRGVGESGILLASSARNDPTVRVWDVEAGGGSAEADPLFEVTPGDDPVNAVAFNPADPDEIALGDEGGNVWLCELDSSSCSSFDVGSVEVTAGVEIEELAFDITGTWLVTASSSAETVDAGRAGDAKIGDVVVWDVGQLVADRSLDRPAPGGEGAPLGALKVAIAPRDGDGDAGDGASDILAVGGADGALWLWDDPFSPGGPPDPIELSGHPGDIGGLAFDPTGAGRLATAGAQSEEILNWAVRRNENGTLSAERVGAPLTEHSAFIADLAFSADGATLVSTAGGVDEQVRFWNRATSDGVGVTSVPPDADLPCDVSCWTKGVAFGPDDDVIAFVGGDGVIRVNEVETGEPVAEQDIEAGLFAVAFHPEDDVLIAGGAGRVAVWDLDDEPTVWQDPNLDADPDGGPDRVRPVRSVAFDAETGLAASADDCGWIRVWDIADPGEPIDVQNATAGPQDEPDEAQCADRISVLTFGAGRLWVGGRNGIVASFEFDDDGTLGELTAATDVQSGNVRGLDVAERAAGGATMVAFGGEDQSIVVTDEEVASRLQLTGHGNEVGAIAIGPINVGDDLTVLASASNDGTVRLWWIGADSDGQFVLEASAVLPPSPACAAQDECFALGVAFSRDGSSLASVGTDGQLHLWHGLAEPAVACELSRELIDPQDLNAELGSIEPAVCPTD